MKNTLHPDPSPSRFPLILQEGNIAFPKDAWRKAVFTSLISVQCNVIQLQFYKRWLTLEYIHSQSHLCSFVQGHLFKAHIFKCIFIGQNFGVVAKTVIMWPSPSGLDPDQLQNMLSQAVADIDQNRLHYWCQHLVLVFSQNNWGQCQACAQYDARREGKQF